MRCDRTDKLYKLSGTAADLDQKFLIIVDFFVRFRILHCVIIKGCNGGIQRHTEILPELKGPDIHIAAQCTAEQRCCNCQTDGQENKEHQTGNIPVSGKFVQNRSRHIDPDIAGTCSKDVCEYLPQNIVRTDLMDILQRTPDQCQIFMNIFTLPHRFFLLLCNNVPEC